MKNCEGKPSVLRKLITNIPNHYKVVWYASLGVTFISVCVQNIHTDCHKSSSCHLPGYVPSKSKLTSKVAEAALDKLLTKCPIYVYAEYFCRVRNLVAIAKFASHH